MKHRASQATGNAARTPAKPLTGALAATFGGCMLSTAVVAQTPTDANHDESPVQLSPMTVEAGRQAAPERSYTIPETNSATGLALSPRETPQSVTSITRQQLDDREAVDIEDALELTPGITASKAEVGVRTSFRARGYDIGNWKVDGLQFSGDSGFGGGGNALNMDLYERIDIVRGANGLLGGTGDPSATVNLIRKRPEREFGGSVYGAYGRWDRSRVGADLNVPLTEDGRVRSRVVVTQQEGDTFRDNESERRRAALANLAFDATDDTTLGLGYQYEYRKTDGAGWGANVPIWFADGSRTHLSRSTNLAPDWSHAESRTNTVFASLNHAFNDDWTLDVHAAQSDTDALNNLALAKVNRGPSGGFIGYWDQDGGGAILNALRERNETRQRSVGVDLSGAYDLFGRRHDLMLGASESRTRERTPEQECTMSSGTASEYSSYCMFRATNGLAISDWRHGVDDDIRLDASRTGRVKTTETRLRGFYAATRLEVTEPLSIILGGRVSDYETDTDAYDGATTSRHEHDVFTPYAGAIYDLSDRYSLYASYTNIFTPQSQRDTGGATVDPVEGDSYEAGIKGEWFDGQLNASAALFRTRQEHLAVMDGGNLTPDGAQAYKSGTGNETEGVDLEVAGAITPNWNVYGGYTYLHFRRVDSDGRSDPSHLFKLSTTYEPGGRLNRWTFGGGVYAQSHIDAVSSPAGQPSHGVSTGSTAVKWPGYAIWNAMARYDITDDTRLSLNVDNLFDQHYYDRYGFYAGAIYGSPRSATLTLRTSF
ncbi:MULTISPECIES: TonB-dependent siderophore receptor [Halomonas]|uniref:TonB-dependent receptor n=1 Tax=Halomonas halophila TaxID=29573 RepID=A0ABQ0U3V1_9GAMM|nr:MULTISPECIES: TonB-dependent siderophore receptor [Halomonas]MDR5889073.1 TonB-dependent siderophore receptor [Halomonas salina]WJY07366.1 TonB-dependent siderophore receptor [Halomonas halophila]GEK73193.1 TonB-dependent receptor [Halomonas halophila]